MKSTSLNDATERVTQATAATAQQLPHQSFRMLDLIAIEAIREEIDKRGQSCSDVVELRKINAILSRLDGCFVAILVGE